MKLKNRSEELGGRSDGLMKGCKWAYWAWTYPVYKIQNTCFVCVDYLPFNLACPVQRWCHCVLNACFDTGLVLPCGCGGIEGPMPCPPKNERHEGHHSNWWSDWTWITVTIFLNSTRYYFISTSFCFFLNSRHHTGLLLMRSTTF